MHLTSNIIGKQGKNSNIKGILFSICYINLFDGVQ